jgi:hypothetical protein
VPKVDLEAVRDATDLTRGDEDRLFADDRAVCTAVLDARRAVASGAPLELSVDHTRMQFFDPLTGAALKTRDHPAVALA